MTTIIEAKKRFKVRLVYLRAEDFTVYADDMNDAAVKVRQGYGRKAGNVPEELAQILAREMTDESEFEKTDGGIYVPA